MSTATLAAIAFGDPRPPTTSLAEIAVSVEGLTKRFPERRTWRQMVRHPYSSSYVTAVDRVTCDITRGELFGLLGPNGAGKTTLFKMLMASTTPDSGTATVLGYDAVRQGRKVRRLISCVLASDRNLYWRLSARENLRLFADLHGVPKPQVRQRIEEVLRVVEIADTGEKMVAMFSSGMRQRLLIARALLSRPRMLLLDEPTRSMDPLSARGFRQLLRKLTHEGEGCTVVLATHNSEEAMELCDRVAILDRGKLLAVGSTYELTQKFGDNVFSVWTRTPYHPAFLLLDAEGRIRSIDVLPADDGGWCCVRFAIHGGLDRAAEVLSCLTASGVEVARFEQNKVSLADLIERVVDRSGADIPS